MAEKHLKNLLQRLDFLLMPKAKWKMVQLILVAKVESRRTSPLTLLYRSYLNSLLSIYYKNGFITQSITLKRHRWPIMYLQWVFFWFNGSVGIWSWELLTFQIDFKGKSNRLMYTQLGSSSSHPFESVGNGNILNNLAFNWIFLLNLYMFINLSLRWKQLWIFQIRKENLLC